MHFFLYTCETAYYEYVDDGRFCLLKITIANHELLPHGNWVDNYQVRNYGKNPYRLAV